MKKILSPDVPPALRDGFQPQAYSQSEEVVNKNPQVKPLKLVFHGETCRNTTSKNKSSIRSTCVRRPGPERVASVNSTQDHSAPSLVNTNSTSLSDRIMPSADTTSGNGATSSETPSGNIETANATTTRSAGTSELVTNEPGKNGVRSNIYRAVVS